MRFQFISLPTDAVRALQAGGLDANGQPPERQVSDGTVGCRHCLANIPEGEACLLVAHTPFTTVQPYAERGPLYLCAEACEAAEIGEALPELLCSPGYIVRGYDAGERILYGTGGVTERGAIPARVAALLREDAVSFVDVRSAANNCFQVRAVRA